MKSFCFRKFKLESFDSQLYCFVGMEIYRETEQILFFIFCLLVIDERHFPFVLFVL